MKPLTPGVAVDMKPALQPAFLLLHPDDNVLVCIRAIGAGETIGLPGEEQRTLEMETAIAVGHKIARQDLDAGVPVIKYGAKIGSTTDVIRAGEHVHLHNMRSDYIASHTRPGAANKKT